MTTDQLRKLHQARPFRPFDIHRADGRALPVDHPEVLAIAPPGRTIGRALADRTIEIVDLLLVFSLKLRPAGLNGRKRPEDKNLSQNL